MGKNKGKNNEEVPNPASVTNRDILQRLNFLYQASVLLNGLAPPDAVQSDDDDDAPRSMTRNDRHAGTDEEGSAPRQSQRKKKWRVVSCQELSRSYIETMKTVGQKTNVKLDPSVKRRVCKRCYAPFIPGVSVSVRVRDSASHGHLISYQCHACQTERRIPAPPVLRVDRSTNGEAVGSSTEDAAAGNAARPARHKRKKGPQPRLPPHFARDVGHVVFRGTEMLDTTGSIP